MQKILTKLDATHRKLLTLVTGVDDEHLHRRPAQNEWSVAEIVQHLSLVETFVINSLERSLSKPPQALSFFRRLIPTRIVAYRLVRVKSPKGVAPLDPPPRKALIENFKATRESLKGFCENVGPKRLRRTTFKHPFLGSINGATAVSFIHYHEVRHHKQIQEVLKKLAAKRK